jgi:hypothetical protein
MSPTPLPTTGSVADAAEAVLPADARVRAEKAIRQWETSGGGLTIERAIKSGASTR